MLPLGIFKNVHCLNYGTRPQTKQPVIGLLWLRYTRSLNLLEQPSLWKFSRFGQTLIVKQQMLLLCYHKTFKRLFWDQP